jgi:glutamate racemase
VGVIGTVTTITSGAYQDAFAAASHLEIHAAACPLFVEYVERGITSGPRLTEAAERYLAPLKQADVDTLVLGCTHYPLLTGLLSVVMGESVTLVSSAEETAKDVYRVLLGAGLLRSDEAPPPRHVFRATGPAEPFRVLSQRFLGPNVVEMEPIGEAV